MNEMLRTYSLLPSGSPTVTQSATSAADAGGLYSWVPTNGEGEDPYFEVESPIATAGGPWESPDSEFLADL